MRSLWIAMAFTAALSSSFLGSVAYADMEDNARTAVRIGVFVDDDDEALETEGSILGRIRERLEAEGMEADAIDQVVDVAESMGVGSTTATISVEPELLEKLKPDQLERVLIAREQGPTESVPLVATVAPVAFFITVIFVVGLSLWFALRSQREKQTTLRAMVEKGVEIPPGMLGGEAPRSDMRRGVILVFTGLGVSLFFATVDPSETAWSLGIIPLMVGLGYLAAHFLDRGGEQPL